MLDPPSWDDSLRPNYGFDGEPTPLCEWYDAKCDRYATGYRSHPVLGQLLICDECNAKVERIISNNLA